ncbi:MAG: quinolinate synthase NadA [Oscillospiraceae bacterium]|nr:quinolinate synthase NadA [Oscillospiraceae bacterium]
MTIAEIQQSILQMKKEQDVCILAHAYQGQEILEVADYVGDSYGLSVQAAKSSCRGVIMCGVRFMAETCKVLCPDKTVWLANPSAGCPMAEQLDPECLQMLKQKYPDYTVVAYINTTSELKTECDVCVTSSSAVQICSRIENDKILFIPDPNLGRYVADQLPDKTFAFYHGGCPRHVAVTLQDVEKARSLHPDALLLVHPECRPEVVAQADYVGSTTGIMSFAEKSSAREFIIGTENSIVEHLQFACPDKQFYPLAVSLTCMNMKVTTLMDIYNCLSGRGGEEIQLSDAVLQGAGRCIRRMVELGG